MNNVTELDVLKEIMCNVQSCMGVIVRTKKPSLDMTIQLTTQLSKLDRRINKLDPNVETPGQVSKLRDELEVSESQEEAAYESLVCANKKIAGLEKVIAVLGEQLKQEEDK